MKSTSAKFGRCCLLLLLAIAFLVESATCRGAEFELTKAELVRARDGLGNVLQKLRDGKPVRIGYFGGSITAANGWRPKTLSWFKEQFPKAAVEEINATIGGTGSDLGVFRYQQDCLRHKPDLVFVEFAVNDGGAPPEQIYRAMEGIVRQTWRADPTTDLCFVYTYANGFEEPLRRGLCPRAATADEHVAAHYGIPSINPALRVIELERAGKLVFRAEKDAKPEEIAGRIVFSNDGVHPLDAGHDIYLQVIREAIGPMQPNAAPRPHELREPLRADNWEAAKLVPIEQAMLAGSWQKLDPQKGLGKSFGNRLPAIWEGTTPGDKLTFRFRGRTVGLYDLVGPDGGQLTWTIDGKQHGPRPRFDSYCTYHRLASLRLAEGLDEGEHAVTVEIHPQQPDRGSVVNRVRNEPNFDPKRYDGTKAWLGFIMMIGEPVR